MGWGGMGSDRAHAPFAPPSLKRLSIRRAPLAPATAASRSILFQVAADPAASSAAPSRRARSSCAASRVPVPTPPHARCCRCASACGRKFRRHFRRTCRYCTRSQLNQHGPVPALRSSEPRPDLTGTAAAQSAGRAFCERQPHTEPGWDGMGWGGVGWIGWAGVGWAGVGLDS